LDMLYNLNTGCFESADKRPDYQLNRKDIHG
jgi:hypothetical protein